MTRGDRIAPRHLYGALAGVATVVAALWTAIPPRYLTNDDVAIRLGLEGVAVPGQPGTGFLLMTHAALGWTLAAVHRALPIPLWDVVLTATLIAGLTALYAAAWTRLGRTALARATAVAAMLVATVPLIVGVQFTIAATVAGGAAVVFALANDSSDSQRRWRIASVIVLVAGLLVRPMGAAAGALAVLLFLTPWALVRIRSREMRLRDAVRVAGVAAILAAGAMVTDTLLYRVNRDWRTYEQYNWITAELAEWGGELPPTETSVIREAAGWSENDWAMLQRWLGVDPAVHGFDQAASAYQARSETLTTSYRMTRLASRAGTVAPDTITSVIVDSAVPAVLALVTTVYAGWRGRLAAALGLVLFLGMCVAIAAVFKDLPFRLLAPLLACVAGATLVVLGTEHREPSPPVAIICLAVVLTALTFEVRTTIDAMRRDRQHTLQVEREVGEMQRTPASLVVIHADAFPSEHWWRPFRRPPVALPALSLAGNNQSPPLQRFLSDTGRQPLLRALCEDPSILIISNDDRLDLVTTYMREHFNRTVRWEPVYEGSFRAWRCVG